MLLTNNVDCRASAALTIVRAWGLPRVAWLRLWETMFHLDESFHHDELDLPEMRAEEYEW